MAYRKHRKFRGVKLLWFFNCGSEVKFRSFRDSLARFSLHDKVKWCYFNRESAVHWEN